VIVRFATFNIRNGRAMDLVNAWPMRRHATATTIAGLGVDVIGLQEVFEFQRRYLGQRLASFRWFGEGRDGARAGEQCPIGVSGRSVSVLDDRTLWYGDTPGGRLPGASFPRIATVVRCRDELSGAEFTVVNTHLDEHLATNRSTSTRQLLEWLDPAAPAVVLGDFNCGPDDAAVIGPLARAGYQLAELTGGTAHDFTGKADGPRIDHIFASPHWTIEEAEVVHDRPGGRLPSDHWPVRATLRLDPA
jgi:endonuclease/exonuclease/phosphatase family metal-dependent hydrolase